MRLRFCGAAGTVTGSCHLLEAAGRRVLVDCGLFQGERDVVARNDAPLGFDPASLDAVILTHAHADHIGRMPRLVREGFAGPIIATRATAELTGVTLLDAAGSGADDDYTAAEAAAVYERITARVMPGETTELDGLRVTLYPAGHIFGSVSPLIEFEEDGRDRRVLFSGDIGRNGSPIIRDPAPPAEVDVLVIESTYGDRDHRSIPDTADELLTAIEAADLNGGNILIPTFSMGRAQEILFHLNDLAEATLLERFTVYFDSPLAARITEVFRRNPELYNADARMLLEGGDDPFEFPGLKVTLRGRDSREIGEIRSGAIILASGGMCEGGRIRRHLVQNLSRPETDVLFLGYQAAGTLGRALVDGVREVRIDGQTVPVRCTIRTLGGFSAHAGRGELLAWARAASRPGTRAFVVHGEPRSARALAGALEEELGLQAHVPAYKEWVDV